MTIRSDPRFLPDIQQLALSRAIETPWLKSQGYIDADGVTETGKAALREDGQARHEDGIRRNVIASLPAAHMVVLGRLIAGEALGDEDRQLARSLELSCMINRHRDGTIEINDFGRQVYALAAGRTY